MHFLHESFTNFNVACRIQQLFPVHLQLALVHAVVLLREDADDAGHVLAEEQLLVVEQESQDELVDVGPAFPEDLGEQEALGSAAFLPFW